MQKFRFPRDAENVNIKLITGSLSDQSVSGTGVELQEENENF
jgi:hypothetical protein